jgi:hypothetical protein
MKASELISQAIDGKLRTLDLNLKRTREIVAELSLGR